MRILILAVILGGFILPETALASVAGLKAITITNNPSGGQTYSLSLQVLMLMTVLTVLPAMLIMMTSFTRIIIVLVILRQAMGMPQTPTNQILIGISLFLTFFIMGPVFQDVQKNALNPYLEEKISLESAIVKAKKPVRAFMMHQTREQDLNFFKTLSENSTVTNDKEVSFFVLMPAFVTSELKTAFQMGFFLFLPFLVIDLVVASVLMAMGMMMLSPLIISLPFKIMLFVLIDGWTLVMGTIAASFGAGS